MRRAGGAKLALPLGGSLLLHMATAAFLMFYRGGGDTSFVPQTVSVRLVAAPAGPRNIGAVTEAPREPPRPAPKAAPQRNQKDIVKTPIKSDTKIDPTKSTMVAEDKAAKTSSSSKNAETKAAKTPPVTEKAGGGDKGGKGTDVTTATFVGLQFPDEGYLQSIINKIMFHFKGPHNFAYVADYEFVITRDGCIQDAPKMLRASGSADFNASAAAAIIKASDECGFSKLPAAWKEDILRVVFRFDPKVIGK